MYVLIEDKGRERRNCLVLLTISFSLVVTCEPPSLPSLPLSSLADDLAVLANLQAVEEITSEVTGTDTAGKHTTEGWTHSADRAVLRQLHSTDDEAWEYLCSLVDDVVLRSVHVQWGHLTDLRDCVSRVNEFRSAFGLEHQCVDSTRQGAGAQVIRRASSPSLTFAKPVAANRFTLDAPNGPS